MRNNLTKKQVRMVSTLELAMRFNRLMLMGETMPAGIISMADARETLWIEDELRRRLLAAIGHDFYPPAVLAKPTMAELRASIKRSLISTATAAPKPVAKSAPKPAQPATQKEHNLGFKVTIINSLGCTVSTLNLHVDGKGKAKATALKTIKQLGLKKATFKIC